MTTHYLACDLGAESGRVMLGTLEQGRLLLEEIHRFPNTPVPSGASLHWNMPKLFDEIKTGLNKAAARNLPIASISADAWGVDYLLFDAAGKLIEPAFHYRDPRTAKGVENAFARVDWKTIFAETGIQFIAINTVFQLMADPPERLASAHCLLGVGDGVNYFLSGIAAAERSVASTMQLYNPITREWSAKLLSALGLPSRLFPAIVPSVPVIGPLKLELARETGLLDTQIVATCSHDTGAAVAAVPAKDGSWAYLSSGTWSLLGVEIPEPIITDASRELNFTNEIGYGNTVRLLKNIIGLWILQECRREWARKGQEYDYATLARLAAEAPQFVSFIHPGDPRFLAPGDMPKRIAEYCREHNQPAPTEPGPVIRCVLESLALLYNQTLRQAETLTGKPIERLHIVGGGSQNELLNQLTANATQLPVIAGPVEATAAGNILLQAIALGHVPTLAAARAIVRDSFEVKTFLPRDRTAWEAATARFARL